MSKELHDAELHYVQELQTYHAVQLKASCLDGLCGVSLLRYDSSFELSLNELLTNHYLIDLHPFCVSLLLELS